METYAPGICRIHARTAPQVRHGSACRARGRWLHAATAGAPALVTLWLAIAPLPGSALEVGDEAPDFELSASDGRSYRLSDFEGESMVILAWFPRAFTSGCTIECKALAENGDRLRRYDVTYFMISVDPLAENTAFADALDADFPLLSDVTKEAARSYDVLYEDRFALRYNFFIDEAGIIRAIDSNVDPQTVVEDMIETLERLEVPAS